MIIRYDYTPIEYTICQHERTEVRKMTTANASLQIKKQCLTCGWSVGDSIKKSNYPPEQLAAIPPWDTELSSRYSQQRQQHNDVACSDAEGRAKAKWDREYQAYLQTPEWQRRRQLVLLRAQGICEGCRSAPASEVHHLTYVHAGDEFLFELSALCSSCHARYHETTRPRYAAPEQSSR